jgi:hypothetical protein
VVETEKAAAATAMVTVMRTSPEVNWYTGNSFNFVQRHIGRLFSKLKLHGGILLIKNFGKYTPRKTYTA